MNEEFPPPPARLFYDPGCGPCRFFAGVSQWASRSRLRSLPYDGEEARRELSGLDDETRFAFAHLVRRQERWSGPAMMAPLVGLTLGPSAERILDRVRPFDRGLRWIYRRFWNYRRTRGCAADTDASTY
jgi:hypothetical protein